MATTNRIETVTAAQIEMEAPDKSSMATLIEEFENKVSSGNEGLSVWSDRDLSMLEEALEDLIISIQEEYARRDQ